MARCIARRARRGCAVALAASLAIGVGAAPAVAATLNVSATADEMTPLDGQCSLREAVAAVDAPGTAGDCGTADGGANTIALGAQQYNLSIPPTGGDDNTTGDLNLGATVTTLTIVGAGAGATSIDAGAIHDRVLSVPTGASATITGLSIAHGRAPDGADAAAGAVGGVGGSGGGVLNNGSLTLTGVAVTGNRAGDGGTGGDSTTTGGAGANGGGGGSGGGVSNTGTLTLTAATISGNQAGTGGTGGPGGSAPMSNGGTGGAGGLGGAGGGIQNLHVLTVSGSTISVNGAGSGGVGGQGGAGGCGAMCGAGNGGAGGVGGNGSAGGGISSVTGALTVTNSTIGDRNSAGAGGIGGHGGTGSSGGVAAGGVGGNGGNGASGGGVRVSSPTSSTLVHVTVAGNARGSAGPGGAGGGGTSTNAADGSDGSVGAAGGVFDQTPGSALQNTIVASNAGGNCSGTFTDGGHDLSFGDGTCPGGSGDPLLGSLQANGGPTATMALGAGSAAIDQVPATGAGCPATDQRGVARPSGAECDIGAYEVTPPTASTDAPTAVGSAGATVNGTVTPNSGDASVHFDYGTTSAYGLNSAVQHVAGTAATAVSAPLGGLSANTTYHYRVVAGTTDGAATGADRTFTTSAAGGGGTVPIVASVGTETISPRVFAAAARGPSALVAARKVGAKVTYTLNEAATVHFTVVRLTTGRRASGGRCVKPTKKNRRARRCTRPVKLHGSFTRPGAMGTNRFRFTGRVAGRKIKPGKYRLVATPVAGGRTGHPARASFRIVR